MPTIPRRPAAPQERRRLQACRLCGAELFAAGVGQAEVARQLGVSRQSVHLWYKRPAGRRTLRQARQQALGHQRRRAHRPRSRSSGY